MAVTLANNRRWEEMEKGSVELAALARRFELFNRTEGKSQKTVDWYNLTISRFQRFLAENRKPIRLAGIGEADVREYILYLQERNRWQENPYVSRRGKLAAISIQTYVRALRAFFNWLYREGYTAENKLAKLRPPKAPAKMVEVLSQEETTRVLKCIDQNTCGGARNYAILVLFLDTGLRLSELRNIELGNINIEAGYVKVMGKGGKERIIPFGMTSQKALLRYLLHFRAEPFVPAMKQFFLNLDGKPLSENSVKMLFLRVARKSGVKRLHPHLCRHTFATNYLVNGGDVFSLQQILGHTTLEMVRRYVTLASSQVAVQHRKFSPMDSICFVRTAGLHNKFSGKKLNKILFRERLPCSGVTPMDRETSDTLLPCRVNVTNVFSLAVPRRPSNSVSISSRLSLTNSFRVRPKATTPSGYFPLASFSMEVMRQRGEA